jgi:hypothetical protein
VTDALEAWLDERCAHDALLSVWSAAGVTCRYDERLLAGAALAGMASKAITVPMPSGLSALPLLAAVHAAALRLSGFPSPFAPRDGRRVVLVTRRQVRRSELLALDGAGAPISPALGACRLRRDGAAVPLEGGRSRPLGPDERLLLWTPSAGIPSPIPEASVVVVDGVDDATHPWLRSVVESLTGHAAIIVFGPPGLGPGPCILTAGWSSLAQPGATAPQLGALALVRGHAAAIDVGEHPDLALAGRLLAAAKPSGPVPPQVLEAGALWRRLSHLVVPVQEHDAAARLYGPRTLSERMIDLEQLRARDLGRRWAMWAETVWGPLKAAVIAAHTSLQRTNPKADALLSLVDRDHHDTHEVDIAAVTRTERDALTSHLAQSGVALPDGRTLRVRSLRDPLAWAPTRATLLTGPPSVALLHRLVAADIGPLNLLCWQHEATRLPRLLQTALTEPALDAQALAELLPAARSMPAPVPTAVQILVTAVPMAATSGTSGTAIGGLLDASELAALAALGRPIPVAAHSDENREERDDLDDLDDLDDGDVDTTIINDGMGRPVGPRDAATVRLSVVAADGDLVPVDVCMPAQARVARVFRGRIERLPVRAVTSGMLLAGLDGLTPFDVLRPALLRARGPIVTTLMNAWDNALIRCWHTTGGSAGLTAALRAEGSNISETAVAQWRDPDRIGPQDAVNIERIGRLAGHPLVEREAAAIAVTMQALRTLHQHVGRLLANPRTDREEIEQTLTELLGEEASELLTQITIWRVLDATSLPRPTGDQLASRGTHDPFGEPAPSPGQPG